MIADEKIHNLDNELLTVMQDLKGILTELVGIISEEQRALSSAGLEDLEAVLERKEMVIQHLNQAEDRRRQIAGTLAVSLGLDEDAGVKSISGRLDGSVSKRLLDLGLEVAELSGRADNLNRINAYLIGSSLNYLDTFINRLAGWQDPNHTYLPGGSIRIKKKSNLLINQEA